MKTGFLDKRQVCAWPSGPNPDPLASLMNRSTFSLARVSEHTTSARPYGAHGQEERTRYTGHSATSKCPMSVVAIAIMIILLLCNCPSFALGAPGMTHHYQNMFPLSPPYVTIADWKDKTEFILVCHSLFYWTY